MRRVFRSSKARAKLVEACRASGLSGKAFAARRGIPASTLYGWLAADARARQPVRLARVVREDSSPAIPASARVPAPAAVVIEVGESRIRINAGFDRSVLAAVLDVLEPRCRKNPS